MTSDRDVSFRLWICAEELNHPHYKDIKRKNTSLLSILQPWPAIFGLIGCIAVFGLASSTWWHQEPTFARVATAYAAVSQAGLFASRDKHLG